MNTSRVKDLKELVSELGIKATCHTIEDESIIPDWAKEKYAVSVCLYYNGREIEFPYFYGNFKIAGCDEFPSVESLVWTISTETEGVEERTFEQWCDEFGYNSDSISALNTYEELKARAVEWSEFINDNAIEFDLRVSGWEY